MLGAEKVRFAVVMAHNVIRLNLHAADNIYGFGLAVDMISICMLHRFINVIKYKPLLIL